MTKTSKKKSPPALPILSPDLADEVELWFDGNEPSVPGESSHSAAVRKEAGLVDEPEPYGRSEDAMLDYIDKRCAWERVEAKMDVMSDASLVVLAAYFAADDADKHRVIADDVLAAACKEYASLAVVYGTRNVPAVEED